MKIVDRLRATHTSLVRELEEAIRQDQHDLFHDGEFADGCAICDKDRELYS